MGGANIERPVDLPIIESKFSHAIGGNNSALVV